ncbi:hypothetical protein TVAG_341200 [Trichomonas vaginalis G3]|uniref:Uncharacterized protein n=1 Tax=Trichomonas vaginalis (strain ATCC PRA-98 / G3) TaxID=412133 RepID=A2DTS9_TRIV3|nr:hypothetical protein TVAGG3_1036900 [Trichomonas vaginalis G3]EAY16226.1 hypothetical protein TVAG_341200 [Trichomonas vaginalis G3]KAI5493269.1 hypothetical protein TVAGG3_1036900 [Trichomonas vaginalis G3]|eukprot:XP_001328449.1 hypothetical protein [Trichomonas vaginalis G3]
MSYYSSIDIRYLEDTHFNNERIFDFLDTNIPLCSLHQTKTVVTVFYFISLAIIYLMWPQVFKESSPLELAVVFFPIIFTASIHVLMTTFYIVFAKFEEASFKTCISFIYNYHSLYPLIELVGCGIIHFGGNDLNLFWISSFSTASLAFDIMFGLYAARSHKITLIFQCVALFPCSVLVLLYSVKLVPVWSVYIPFFAYGIIYLTILLSLLKCNKTCSTRTVSFLADPEIKAEFIASDDYESFWNAAYWRDNTQVRRRSESDDSSSSDEMSSSRTAPDTTALINIQNKKEQKFPKKENFQLYKLDTMIEKPIFITSLTINVAFIAFVAVAFVNSFKVIPGFYYIIGCFPIVLLIISLLNSRSFGYNSCVITNINNDHVEILWDHPSFSSIF